MGECCMQEKNKLERTKPKEAVFAILSVVVVMTYPGLFIYFNNIGIAKFVDILPVMSWFLLGAGIVLPL